MRFPGLASASWSGEWGEAGEREDPPLLFSPREREEAGLLLKSV
jgi:hypothetical protein